MEVQQDSPLLRYRKTIIALLGVALLLLLSQFLYLTVQPVERAVDRNVFGVYDTPDPDWSDLGGKIVLALHDPASVASMISLYEQRIGWADMSLLPYPADLYGARWSHDGMLVAATRYIDKRFPLIVMSADSHETGYVELSSPHALIARMPSWSHDDTHVAYMTRDDLNGGDRDVESWSIYVVDVHQADSERFVTLGAYPLFLQDGTLLVLRRDGIYRYRESDLEWVGERILSVGGDGTYPEMHMSLSKDGTELLITNPTEGSLNVFALSYTGSGLSTVEKIDEFPVFALWPVFSPDGRYIAYIEVDSAIARINPRIKVIDRSTGGTFEFADLSRFPSDLMYMTDWITL